MRHTEDHHALGTGKKATAGTKPGKPFANTQVAKFISQRLSEIAPRKNQRIIASAVGYAKPNVISMMKNGEMKVPVEKVPLLAEALEVDPGHLFRLTIEQYWPDRAAMISKIFGNVVSDNEMALVKEVRTLTEDKDPPVTKELSEKLREVFER